MLLHGTAMQAIPAVGVPGGIITLQHQQHQQQQLCRHNYRIT
jgi:hypothetical protein